MATRGRRGRAWRLATVVHIALTVPFGPLSAPILCPQSEAGCGTEKVMMLGVQGSWGGRSADSGTCVDLALDCCVTFGKLWGFSGPHFPHLNYRGK